MMVPTYFACRTICISRRNSSQFSATFAIVQIEANNGIHRAKCWCQCSDPVPKGRGSHREVVSVSALSKLQKNSKLSGFLGIIDSWSHRKIGSKAIAKKETTRRTTLSYSSGHEELPSFFSREFHVCDAVPVNTSQETTEKGWQSSVLELREDPGVIDTGIGEQQSQSKGYLILSERTRRGPERWSHQRCCLSSA